MSHQDSNLWLSFGTRFSINWAIVKIYIQVVLFKDLIAIFPEKTIEIGPKNAEIVDFC